MKKKEKEILRSLKLPNLFDLCHLYCRHKCQFYQELDKMERFMFVEPIKEVKTLSVKNSGQKRRYAYFSTSEGRFIYNVKKI